MTIEERLREYSKAGLFDKPGCWNITEKEAHFTYCENCMLRGNCELNNAQ